METRRTFVRGLGLAAGVALAGCSSSGESDSSGDGDSSSGGDGSDGGDTESSDGGSGSEWTETSTVEMTDGLAYEPKKIQVESGTTVTFENVGSIGHTVTAYENAIPADAAYFATGGFESQAAARDAWNTLGEDGIIGPGQTFSYTFEIPGRYEYFCIPHERGGMVGTIVVEES